MRSSLERVISHGILRLPRSLLLGLVGEKPRVVDGCTLDYQIQFGIALEARRKRTRVHEMNPEQARSLIAAAFEALDVDREPMAGVRDWMAQVPGRQSVPVRVYTPPAHGGGMLVFFHGGGGVVGSVAAYDRISRYLAKLAQVVVVSVDYRLAPEHRYPAGIDDAVTAYLWARTHAAELSADPGRVAVGGDSMGGNFAAQVCLRCKQGAMPMPAYQWLIYPGTDMTRAAESHQLLGQGYVLDTPLLSWFIDHYLADHDLGDPGASPLFADDLAGLPAALVVTAGFDPLRDEGRRYAERLAQAGGQLTHTFYPELVHGFLQMGGAIRRAREAIDASASALAEALA